MTNVRIGKPGMGAAAAGVRPNTRPHGVAVAGASDDDGAMADHVVCLTFDFDVVSGFIARGLTTPTPMSRGEFGLVGARRILKTLARHEIPATWFIPGYTIESYPEAAAEVVAAGHEIGHHGWQHTPPAKFSRDEEAAELERGNAAIERLCGRRARGYRSPSWDLSAHTVELLIAQDFLYDSSLMGDDHTPYMARSGDVVSLDQPMQFGAATGLVEMPISWTLDDFPHFEYFGGALPGLRASSAVLENWLDDFAYMREHTDWGVLTYTFHPFVIGRGHRMMMLERLIEALRLGGARFATMEDAAREWLAHR